MGEVNPLVVDAKMGDALSHIKLAEQARKDTEEHIRVLDEAIAIETRDYNRSKESISKSKRLAEIFKTVVALGNEAVEVWEKFKDGNENLEKGLKDYPGGSNGFAKDLLGPLANYEVLLPAIERHFNHDEHALLAPYEQNITDLRELRDALILNLKIDDTCIEAMKLKPERRKAVFRDLYRLNKKLAASCPSILHKKFASPNVPKEATDLTYNYVKKMIDQAKEYAEILKKHC